MMGAKVEKGVVVNIAMFGSVPEDWYELSDGGDYMKKGQVVKTIPLGAGIGWTLEKGKWARPKTAGSKTLEDCVTDDSVKRLKEIDTASIRSLRAIAIGEVNPEDLVLLEKLEQEAVKLRKDMQKAKSQ